MLRRMVSSLTKAAQKEGPAGRKELTQANRHKAENMAQFISQHYLEPIGKEDFARSVNLNASYAIRLFHGTFGVSPVDAVNRFRVAHAQRRLLTTDQSIVEIALDSGFGSLVNFYLVFKRICGQTPNEFRKLHSMQSRQFSKQKSH